MIGGGSVIAGCMLTMGGLYASNGAQTKAGKRTLIALIYIFIAAFISSWAVVILVISSEMQPKRTRAPASSLAQCFSWVCFNLCCHSGFDFGAFVFAGGQLDHRVLDAVVPDALNVRPIFHVRDMR